MFPDVINIQLFCSPPFSVSFVTPEVQFVKG